MTWGYKVNTFCKGELVALFKLLLHVCTCGDKKDEVMYLLRQLVSGQRYEATTPKDKVRILPTRR
jgi:hypothetical protein